jgi:hypothetical protein
MKQLDDLSQIVEELKLENDDESVKYKDQIIE